MQGPYSRVCCRSIRRDLVDFEIAGWNEPADETGGDYFDWQVLPDGRVAISLADATGHGIGPALVSVSCRAYARASLLADGKGDGVLGRLNSLLAEDLESNRFVTFAVIFLDPKRSSVRVLSAGHGPILWYRHATDKMDRLEAQGIPLGMLDGFDYENTDEGPLGEGDFLALVTDGFFEWENPEGEDFGVARMETILRDSRDLPAEEMVEKLRAAVDVFCRGTKQMDDLTAVILKRKRPISTNGSPARQYRVKLERLLPFTTSQTLPNTLWKRSRPWNVFTTFTKLSRPLKYFCSLCKNILSPKIP